MIGGTAPATLMAPVPAAISASDMYRQHHDAVFRYIRARVGSHAEAEDLTSDVFCKAVVGLSRYRPLRSSALPWLYTIAAHRVADHYRAARPTNVLDDADQVPDRAPSPLDVAVTHDLVRQVWELAKRLPASQRTALWLRYGEELELREIAARMGRSVEAVKLLVHRAVRAIRGSLVTSDAIPVLTMASVKDGRGQGSARLARAGLDQSRLAA